MKQEHDSENGIGIAYPVSCESVFSLLLSFIAMQLLQLNALLLFLFQSASRKLQAYALPE